MKTVLIDGRKIQDKRFHEYFKKKLDIIGYYGNNLDAMFDVLSTYNDELNIYIFNIDHSEITEYGIRVMKTLEDIMDFKDNINLKIIKIKRK